MQVLRCWASLCHVQRYVDPELALLSDPNSLKIQTLMGEEIWLDPDHEEAAAGASTLVLACMPALGVVTNVWQNGTMSPKQALEVSFKNVDFQTYNFPDHQCMTACHERCATIHSIVAQSLVSNFVQA